MAAGGAAQSTATVYLRVLVVGVLAAAETRAVVGVLAVPLCLWLLHQESLRTGRPGTRLGIVWRFMFYGGLLAAALGAVFAVVQSVLQWLHASNWDEAMGGSETSLLLYGVGGLSIAVLVGVSYALWAGLCAAFIAFRPQPEVRDRLGLMGGRDTD